LNPKRELNARLGDARAEYVVDREPVRGVSVSVRVYGKLDMGFGVLPGDVDEEDDGVRAAAGNVVNLTPVESPTSDDIGE
jgi:hypothetical protein